MSLLSRKNVLMGLFMLGSVVATRNAMAENPPGAADFNGDVKIGAVKFDATTDPDKSKIGAVNDSVYLKHHEGLGMTLVSRQYGTIEVRDEQGNVRHDPAMFYKYEKEVDGMKVEMQDAVVHGYDDATNDFNHSYLLYRGINIADETGKRKAALVLNETATLRATGRMAGCVTDKDGKQTTIYMGKDMIADMDSVLNARPGAVVGFVDDMTQKYRKKREFHPETPVQMPGYHGQDVGGGVFEIIKISPEWSIGHSNYLPSAYGTTAAVPTVR